MSLAAEPLTPDHDLVGFNSGNDELDRWLIEHALAARRQGTRTYVLVDPPHQRALGYFAIAPHLVRRDDLSRSFGRGMPRTIPAILLAKLALDRELQGSGIGSELLVRALSVIVTAARKAGGKLVVVDAVDEGAAAFYAAHDFVPLPGADDRLVHRLSSAAKALELEWP